VSGRNQIGFANWVKLDVECIDTWSLTSDFKFLLRTIPTVLRGTGS
jgi:lipopolysaccharide/colanic/teichoic acid biosynthesis glycosyltransferase